MREKESEGEKMKGFSHFGSSLSEEIPRYTRVVKKLKP